MSMHRCFLQTLSILVILAMLFSGFSMPSVSAQEQDGLERQINTQTGKVSFLGPEDGRTLSASRALGTSIRPQDPAMALAKRFGPEFGLKDPARDLSEMNDSRSEDGRISTRYQQSYQGIPVIGGELIINTNDNGDLYSMNGEVSSNLSLSTTPTIASEHAQQTALQAVAKWYEKTPNDFVTSEPALWIYDESLLRPSTRPAELVWRMEVTPKDAGIPVRELVLVNAQRGSISLHFNQIDTAWSLNGNSGAIQDPDATPTPPPTETPFPTATAEPVVTATPAPEEPTSTEEVPAEPRAEAAAVTGATWYVATTGSDSNSCSTSASPCATIQAAINKAAADDMIAVAAGTYAPVTISKSLTLSGGWDTTFNSQSRHSFIQGSTTVDGISTSGTVVSIARFVVQNSKYGIYHSAGTLRFEQGALINNRNGLYNYRGDTTFTNTTISGHQSTSPAGSAISNVSGLIKIQSSTITGNGGNRAISSTNGDARIEIGNRILAGNAEADCYVWTGNMTSTGYNIFGRSPACSGPSSNVFVPHPTDQLGVDPRLSSSLPLGYYPLLPASPAIDQGDPVSCPAADQRGVTRPQGTACDIGAYEYASGETATSFGLLWGSNQHSGPSLPFQSPLAVYVVDASGNPVSGVTVTFTAPASGPGGTFADSSTNITAASTDGEGIAVASMFTANSQLGDYDVIATVDGLPGSVSFALTNAALFVSPVGSDANFCTSPASPCLTINGAITKAVNGDAIKVAVGTYAPVSISKNLTILGGWDTTFTSQTGYSTIQGGATVDGISTTGANVSFSRFVSQGNRYGIAHGAGTLRFEQGALIDNKNGLYNSGGDASFTNTTISGATETAITNLSGTIRIQYSTISNNAGSYAIYSIYGGAHIEIGNSILAGNKVADCYVGNTNMISTGHNIFGRSPACSSSSAFVPDPTDQVGTNPQLSTLFPVGYHPLSPTSPAVDQGNPDSCPATDQRGVARPQGTACDIGAYEYMAAGTADSFGIASGSEQHSGPSLPFQSPLAVYVMDTSGSPVSGVTVTFTAPASGPSGTFANSGTNITTVPTNGDGIAITSTFTANSQLGNYNVIATVAGLPGSVSFALTNAAWFVSPTGSDANSCSSPASPCLTLNGAITKASDGDAIKVAVGTYTPAIISKNLTLLGGWDTTFTSQTGYSTIQGSPTSRGISTSGTIVSISRFIVRNNMYGIDHTAGTLRFDQGALINNNNGIYNRYGDTTFTNTTISGNDDSSIPGSAISNDAGTIRIQYSTIANNTGQAIYNVSNNAHIEIGNSILAGNSGADCHVKNGNMTSAGHNIFGRSPACSDPADFVPDPTDQVGVDPQLSTLTPLGYHLISSTSPAVDQGNPATCPATDQRDVTRPQGIACDIGAFEYMASGAADSFEIASGSNQHSGPSLPFQLPLTVYVMDASGGPISGVTVTFMAPASGPSSTFADTDSNTTIAVTNDSGLATSSVFTANSEMGSYTITATVSGLPGSVSFALVNAAWFVSPTGNNGNSCTVPTSPCLTINGAIGKATNGESIQIAVGTYAPVTIYKSLTLQGGWDTTFTSQTGYSTIDGNGSGEGIWVEGQNVSISRFIVQNTYRGMYHGGTGTLRFDHGALIRNSQGFYNNSGDTALTNTTISGSTGIGINNGGGTVRIQNSTITNNGGFYGIESQNDGSRIEIGNSILAGNNSADCSVGISNMISTGHNIFGRSPACSDPSAFVPDPTDQVGVDPQLSTLLPPGYHALTSTSPAINAADPLVCPFTDQRGVSRPQGTACDIGAFEYAAPGAAASSGIISGSNQHSGPSLPFQLPLAVYVVDASGNPVSGVTVTFTAPASGPSVTFADSNTNATTVPTNSGGVAITSMFTANSQLGSYNIVATVAGLPGSVSFALVNAAWFVSPTGSNANSCSSPTSPCLTLNGAIGKAANGDAVMVAAGTYTPMSIPKSLTILGGWDTTFSSRIGYSIVQGDPNVYGHAISVDGQNVFISRFIAQNTYHGIYHGHFAGLLHFDQGALLNNSNGLRNMSGDVILTNTTISGNYVHLVQGTYSGGSAISNLDGLIRIQHSTITNNGGTEAIWSTNGSAQIEIGNSILADNPGGDCDRYANVTSAGHNLFGSLTPCGASSEFVGHATDQLGADPKLFSIFPNGYHPLLPGSPAVDAADPLGCPAVDQRGVARPAGAACDIGAVEYNPVGTTPSYILAYRGSPQTIRINSVASSGLVAVVFDEDGDSVQGKTVTFSAPAQGASVIFADTDTNIVTVVTDADGFATSPAFSANSVAGRYSVVATVHGTDISAGFSLINTAFVLDPMIETYTANNYVDLPGTFLCDQMNPVCTNGRDVHADAAHRHAIGTYFLYVAEHNRNSIDNRGMPIISSVHFHSGYANAAWNGSQMYYGDAFGFSLADDVVAHELTHGVTENESNLFYYYQSGAINESLSDVWGEYYDQTNGQGEDTTAVKWLIGEDVSGLGALRSLSDPPAYGDPDKMSSGNYHTDTSDNGGVHTNSGINNKAVFLMVNGGSFNGKTVIALGWEKTIAIYYEANTNLLSSGADYSDLYYALQQACMNLIGQKGITTGDCGQVKNAIDAVEMNGQPVANFNPDAPYCDPGKSASIIFSDGLEAGTGNWTFGTRWRLDSPYGLNAHSGVHSLYADDYPDTVTDTSARLVAIPIPTNAYLHFAHAYDFEAYEASGYYDDGGVLEYSINGGSTWSDAGSLIDFNGYKGTIRTGLGNPLQGRSAFVGSSHGYISTRLNLASLAGKTVIFRWRMGLDQSGYAWGWWVDDINVYTCESPSIPSPDTTGVFRPSNGVIFLKNANTSGFAEIALNYGVGGDYPVVGDWDGNGTTTIGIYRNGSFYLRNSNTKGIADFVFPFGMPGDQPVAGDWDGDGDDTIGIYRPSTGQFLLRNSNSAGNPEMTFVLGNPGDVGIAGDWDGDGLDTTGVFRPSNGILFLKNTNSTGFAEIALNYGIPGDKPVTGDWDGNGTDTIGINRNGTFYLRNSNTKGVADMVFKLGNPGDMPIAGDWDGQP